MEIKKINSMPSLSAPECRRMGGKELCEKGLKTLVLERGRNVEHVVDYLTILKNPWKFMHGTMKTQQMIKDAPIQSTMYNFDETSHQFFVKDVENPYNQVKPYN